MISRNRFEFGKTVVHVDYDHERDTICLYDKDFGHIPTMGLPWEWWQKINDFLNNVKNNRRTLFACTAQVRVGGVSYQIPSFILNGPVNEEHAKSLIEMMFNPENDPNRNVHACAVPWMDV